VAGRPSKLTPEIQERICQLIRAGNTVEIASEASGITPTTFYNWMQKGADGRQPYADFSKAIEQVRAEAEAILVGRIQRAAQSGSWRAATWLLERQWPERWAPAGDRAEDEETPDFADLDELGPRRAQKAA
jgi:transposase